MSQVRIEPHELNAFVDGELELSRQLELEARLAVDGALLAEVEQLRLLRDAVRSRADYHAAPPALRALLLIPAGTEPAAARRVARFHWRRWFAWRPMGLSLAAAALFAAVLMPTLWQADRDAHLMQDVIASHVRSTVGDRLVDVASADRHTVKPWLSAKLDFSPPVADAPVAGASFLGGRVDYLDGRPVAALVYRQRQHVIDAYVWPGAQADAAMATRSERGFNSVHWARAGMRFWLVSDLNRDELFAFAQALALADAAR